MKNFELRKEVFTTMGQKITPYAEVLKQELLFTQNKLTECSDEGRSILKHQIEQIKRDILHNST